MKPYSKCIAAFISSTAATLTASLGDGITRDEAIAAVLVGIASGAGVYLAPKNAER